MTDPIAITSLVQSILDVSVLRKRSPTDVLETLHTGEHVWLTLHSDTTKEAISKGLSFGAQQESFNSDANFIDSYSKFVIRVFETQSDLKSLCEGLSDTLKRLDLTNDNSVRFHTMIAKRAFRYSLKKIPTTRNIISSVINDLMNHHEFSETFHISNYTFMVFQLRSVLEDPQADKALEEQKIQETKRLFKGVSFKKLGYLHAEDIVTQSAIPILVGSILSLPTKHKQIRAYRTSNKSDGTVEVNGWGMLWDWTAHFCYIYCGVIRLIYQVEIFRCYGKDLHHGAVKILSQTGVLLLFDHFVLQSSIPHLGDATVIPCFVASFVVLIQMFLNPELFD
ncbi:hypothetical protein WICPIJ_008230 [Wickerhamomyces pijperi]|uniref:Uncharacterized protein n=1 Tax=Wickerhamomyces pijperi TaxID=599730 RepID=A0A9P8TIY8_WICPI|nr:hypothetical protein WICPIJ_008230 [Wickerhamomyces pijperi]